MPARRISPSGRTVGNLTSKVKELGLTQTEGAAQEPAPFSTWRSRLVIADGGLVFKDAAIYADASAGDIDLTLLPAAQVDGRVFVIQKTDPSSNIITITPAGGESINGADAYVIGNQYEAAVIHSTGSEYRVISLADTLFSSLTGRTFTASPYQYGADGDGIGADSAAIQAAADAIDAAGGGTLLINGNFRVDSSITIPESVEIWRTHTGLLSIDALRTVAILGRIRDTREQIFSGAGTVSLGPAFNQPIRVRWFGGTYDGVTSDWAAVQEAIKASIGTGLDWYTTVVIPNNCLIDVSIDSTNQRYMIFQGETPRTKVIGACPGRPVFDLLGSAWIQFKDIWILGDSTDTPSVGWLLGRTATNVNSAWFTFDKCELNGHFEFGGLYSFTSELILWTRSYIELFGPATVKFGLCWSADELWAGAIESDYETAVSTHRSSAQIFVNGGGGIVSPSGGSGATEFINVIIGPSSNCTIDNFYLANHDGPACVDVRGDVANLVIQRCNMEGSPNDAIRFSTLTGTSNTCNLISIKDCNLSYSANSINGQSGTVIRGLKINQIRNSLQGGITAPQMTLYVIRNADIKEWGNPYDGGTIIITTAVFLDLWLDNTQTATIGTPLDVTVHKQGVSWKYYGAGSLEFVADNLGTANILTNRGSTTYENAIRYSTGATLYAQIGFDAASSQFKVLSARGDVDIAFWTNGVKVGAFSPLAADPFTAIVINYATDKIPLIVKGKASQTTPMQQWRDSADAVLAEVTLTGVGNFSNAGVRTRVVAGTPTGGASGDIAIDSTANKIWVNIGGTWKSVAVV